MASTLQIPFKSDHSDTDASKLSHYSRSHTSPSTGRFTYESHKPLIGAQIIQDELTDTQLSDTLPPITTKNDADLRVGADTPETEIGVFSSLPDITIFCGACSKHIDLQGIKEHRYYHKALELLRYTGASMPDSTEALLKRRRAILRKMKRNTTSESPLDPSDLNRLNEAYEFLKAIIEDTYEACRHVKEKMVIDVRGVALNCSAECAYAVGICSDANERWKSQMEDTRVFQDYFGNDINKCYFGIYDGHHGRFAAEIAANELHHALLLEMSKFDAKTKCTCTFNMADSYDISKYADIHSRPSSSYLRQGEIHETSSNIIQQIISTCEDKLSTMDNQKSEKTEDGKSPDKLEKQKKQKSSFDVRMASAFKKAHKCTDWMLSWGKDEMSRVRWSGCSTLACVIQNKPQCIDKASQVDETNKENVDPKVNPDNENGNDGKSEAEEGKEVELKELGVIHLANAGDVQAVLVRGDRAYRLTKDHTPNSPRERSRVLREGGTINESEREMRVNGVLATTRGLGNHGDPALKRCVITEPYTTSVKIDQFAQFLILASHGVWDVLCPDEAASLLLQVLPSHQVPAPSRLSVGVGRLLEGPISTEPPSEVISDVATDYHAANRKEIQRLLREGKIGERPSSVISIKLDENESSGSESEEELPIIEEHIAKELSVSSHSAEIGSKKVAIVAPAKKIIESRNKVDPNQMDLLTEVGSRINADSDEESGNEGDIDTTFTDVMTGIVSHASQHIPSKAEIQREYAKQLSERLVQAALLAGSKHNITVMVVLLPGCGV